jgi:hypothetical protein
MMQNFAPNSIAFPSLITFDRVENIHNIIHFKGSLITRSFSGFEECIKKF